MMRPIYSKPCKHPNRAKKPGLGGWVEGDYHPQANLKKGKIYKLGHGNSSYRLDDYTTIYKEPDSFDGKKADLGCVDYGRLVVWLKSWQTETGRVWHKVIVDDVVGYLLGSHIRFNKVTSRYLRRLDEKEQSQNSEDESV